MEPEIVESEHSSFGNRLKTPLIYEQSPLVYYVKCKVD